MLAGYGIAIPVGAIAILIIETGIRRGFLPAFAAGVGAATADVLYALLAVLAGQFLADLLSPIEAQIRLFSALVLVSLGGWGVWTVLRRLYAHATPDSLPLLEPSSSNLPQIYAKFVSLTLLNPLTIAYFTALIMAQHQSMPDLLSRVYFISGAGLASLSWQAFLACLGALAHRGLSPRFQRIASLAGHLIVVGLGIRIFLEIR